MNFYPVMAYLRHRLYANSSAGHGVHSPFIYDFLTTVLRNKTSGDVVSHIESLRREMTSDKRIINVTDLGAGSLKKRGAERRVAEIAGSASLPVRYAEQLARIAGSMEHRAWSTGQAVWSMEQRAESEEQRAESEEQRAESKEQRGESEEQRAGITDHPQAGSPLKAEHGIFLELGTSLGISTLAIALAVPGRRVVSVEGCPEQSKIARTNLEQHGAVNTEVLNMGFTDALKKLRADDEKVIFAFIDGDHRGEALVSYVKSVSRLGDEMIIVADDIHLSKDMYRGWRMIIESGMAEASVESNRFGILFMRSSLTPGRYKVWC